jgi:Protein of unknown function (DUF3619)
MSTALDQKEAEFALKVCRALDESITTLPAASLDQLAAARRTAIARKKPEEVAVAAPVFAPALAGAGGSSGGFETMPAPKRGNFSRWRGRCLRWLSGWQESRIGKTSNARLNSPISTPPC